jgi:para-aminobenzoate synthetase component 1
VNEPSLPVVVELPGFLQPMIAAQRLRTLDNLIFLDSSLQGERLGRYSFVAADARFSFRHEQPDAGIFAALDAALRRHYVPDRADLPPWQGGVAGFFGYELSQALECIPATRRHDFSLPAFDLEFYDVVVAFDHQLEKAWIISSGQGGPESLTALQFARERADFFHELLVTSEAIPYPEYRPYSPLPEHICDSFDAPPSPCPQFPVFGLDQLTSNFSRDAYLTAVRRVIDYIHAGDAFQVNLSQRLLFPCQTDPFDTYLRLRERNPAPFSAYFDGGYYQIASASPERFLLARSGRIETRPIKGTRRRLASPEADLFRGDELRASEKDRAENVMIVDLLRNDLSKVCTDDSICVTELCRLETYAFVQHLVSTVVGRLRSDVGLAEAVRACFPGGSITGAPKVRAMEIISELEPTPRGPYCGSLGYLGFNGAMDLNILIRTMTAAYGHWQFPVGGGIVADSDPQSEYEETLSKAVGLVRSLLA